MKFLKITSLVIVSLIILLALGFTLLILFVSPNRFKPILVERVMKRTGRELVIDGDLSWRFFPNLGIGVGHATLSNPPEFVEKTFAEFDEATFSVRVLPLLRGRIESSGLILKGARLILIKKPNGAGNWAFNTNTDADKNNQKTNNTTLQRASVAIAVSGIDISDAAITWIDQQTKQTYFITNFSFKAQDVNLVEPFPINASFDFAQQNASLNGQVKIKSNLSYNFNKQIFSFRDFSLISNINKENKKIHSELTGNVIGNLDQQTLQANRLSGRVANINLIGDVNITQFLTDPVMHGEVKIAPFNLKQTFDEIGVQFEAIQSTDAMSGNIEFNATTESLTANGKFHLNGLTISNLRLKDITTDLQLQKNILVFKPLTASLYQGTFEGEVKVDLDPAVPTFQFQGKLNNISATPLLKDLAPTQKIKIVGTGNITFQLTTAGTNAEMVNQNLNGNATVSFADGYIDGIDIGFLLDTANSVIGGGKLPTVANTDKTTFGTLTASALIQNGVINNKDLYLNAPRFDTHGKGNINLVSHTIDYGLQTTAKQTTTMQNDFSNLYGMVIPIQITGKLDKPKIILNTGDLLKSIAEQQLKKAVIGDSKENLNEQIKKQLPHAKELLKGIFGQ